MRLEKLRLHAESQRRETERRGKKKRLKLPAQHHAYMIKDIGR